MRYPFQMRLVVRNVEGNGGCVFAGEDIAAGEAIEYFEGREVCANRKFSATFGGKIIEGAGVLKSLAHSCAPNACFKDGQRWLYALEHVNTGDQSS
jgi:hypothetical protein